MTFLTPEEDFNNTIFWVCSELKKEQLATQDGEYIQFLYLASEVKPTIDDQKRAIRFLEKHSAIKIPRYKYPFGIFTGSTADVLGIQAIGCYVDILQPAFDNLFSEYVKTHSSLYFNGFDDKHFVLKLGNREVSISRSKKVTDPVLLLGLLSKAPDKYWYKDEILSDWGYREDDEVSKNKVYYAARNLNSIIGLAAGIDDFIDYNIEKFRINPKYLKVDA